MRSVRTPNNNPSTSGVVVTTTSSSTGTNTNTTTTDTNASTTSKPTSEVNALFLTQLKDLTNSISNSFESISTSLDSIKSQAGKITALSAELNVILDNKQQKGNVNGAGNNTTNMLTTSDIDNSLMILAQQAQDGLKNDKLSNKSLKKSKKLSQPPTQSQSQSQQQQSTTTNTNPNIDMELQVVDDVDDDDINNNNIHSDLSPPAPEIDLNPRAKTVQDLWIEWNSGYRDQPPLRFLEKHHGTRWRRGRIAKSAQRRKKVIEFIESENKRNPHVSIDDVVDRLDKYRQKKNKGLFWLYGCLPNHLYMPDGSPIEFFPDDDDDDVVGQNNNGNQNNDEDDVMKDGGPISPDTPNHHHHHHHGVLDKDIDVKLNGQKL
ncbi:hypothetical protein CANARDRAFT_7889 [[Candida] arabinofermentans NRRL YB-2248]|uniref:Transcription activator GCR1-like domain-containing protein n=1 Tax=[Candida] arabinofermentans NRRL YB-2248 TaxID=983967 RepID=A0A1E4T0I2_9ASCO|nr:hypothetical protein CANARDRAFT_7889 [[Candida] arabinofermentans NRRL YB-2248]